MAREVHEGAIRVNTQKQDTSDVNEENIEPTVGNDESSMGYYVEPVEINNRNNIHEGSGAAPKKTTTLTINSSRAPIPTDAVPLTNRIYIHAKENRLEFRGN